MKRGNAQTKNQRNVREYSSLKQPSQIGIYNSREILLSRPRDFVRPSVRPSVCPVPSVFPSIRYNFSANRIRDFVAVRASHPKTTMHSSDLPVTPPRPHTYTLLSVYRSRFLFSPRDKTCLTTKFHLWNIHPLDIQDNTNLAISSSLISYFLSVSGKKKKIVSERVSPRVMHTIRSGTRFY